MSLLDRLRRKERAGNLQSGPGASVLQTPYGRVVRFRPAGASFDHPWLAALEGNNAATFLPGFVNGGRLCAGKNSTWMPMGSAGCAWK